MSMATIRSGVATLMLILVLGQDSASHAAATLSLSLTAGSGPVPPGGLVQVEVKLSGLTTSSAAGFQAFLHYDSTRLQFINGAYTSAPFGLTVISPIAATTSGGGGDIDLASGINQFAGQSPTLADAPLAYLTFISINSACNETAVQFRSHNPPSRVTALDSVNILPLTLIGLQSPAVTCHADINRSSVIDIDDLVIVITHWGRCPPQPAGCCLGDLVFPLGVGDHMVNIDDLVAVITSWGPCSP